MPTFRNMFELMNRNRIISDRKNEISDNLVVLQVSDKTFTAKAHDLIKSDYLYDEIKKNQRTESVVESLQPIGAIGLTSLRQTSCASENLSEKSDNITIAIQDEDPTIFNMMLLYIKYPKNFPPKEHEQTVLSLLNKYGISEKFKNETVSGYAKYILESSNGTNINDLYFSLTNETSDVLDDIYMQGVDINYSIDNLYSKLINSTHQCHPDFLHNLYSRGREDFVNNLLELLYASCQYSTPTLINVIYKMCIDNKITIDYVKMYQYIHNTGNKMNILYFLSSVTVNDEQKSSIMNIEKSPQTELTATGETPSRRESDQAKCRSDEQSSTQANDASDKCQDASNQHRTTNSEKEQIKVRVRDEQFNVEKDILNKLSKINTDDDEIVIDEDPKLFEIIINYIKYPKYIIPRDFKDAAMRLLTKYDIKEKQFDEVLLTMKAKYLINKNNGDINKAFADARFTDYETLHSIYMQGVDINFDINERFSIWNNAINAHRQCHPSLVRYLMERGRKDFDDHIVRNFTNWACAYSSIECLEEFFSVITGNISDDDILICLHSLMSTGELINLKYVLMYKIFMESLTKNIDKLIDSGIIASYNPYKLYYIMYLSKYTVTKECLLKVIGESFNDTMFAFLTHYLENGGEPFEIDENTIQKLIKSTSDRISKLKMLQSKKFIVNDLELIIEQEKNNLLPKPSSSRHCLVRDFSYFN